MLKRSYLAAAAIAAAVGAWVASGDLVERPSEPPEEPAHRQGESRELPAVQVRTVQQEPHTGRLVLFGRSEADRAVQVRAETAARVAERTASKGDRVTAGDVLVRLRMDDRKARLQEAEARVEQARIAYDAAKELAQREFRSKVKLAEERANLQQARAALAAIELDIDRTRIRAPFDGTVDDLPVEEGDYVNAGTTVARLLDLDPVVIVGHVAEHQVQRLHPGAEVPVRLTGGRQVTGTIRFVARAAREATRTFRVEVTVPNPDTAIPEGITAELRLPTETRMAHRVTPALLTLNDAGVLGVKAVTEDDRVVFHPAEIIADAPDGMWLAGLPETVRLITVGQEFVTAGQKVRPVPERRVEHLATSGRAELRP